MLYLFVTSYIFHYVELVLNVSPDSKGLYLDYWYNQFIWTDLHFVFL